MLAGLIPILLGRPGWVLPGASIDLDFVNARGWDGHGGPVSRLLTVSRASVGYIDDTAGNWTQFAANALRRSNKGALIEEARTNVILWCSDLTNAAWTKSNVTAAMDQTGPDGTANSASSITATAGNGTALQAITLASSARFQSAFVKRITGSGVVNLTMDNGSTWTAVTVTSDWTRVSIPTQTLANPTVGFRIVTSGDKIAVAFIQNENGTFITSPILATSAAATRAADAVSQTNFAFGPAYSFFAQGVPNTTSYAQNSRVLSVNAGDVSHEVAFYRPATNALSIILNGSGFGSSAWSAAARGKGAAAIAASDQAYSFNGGAVTTNAAASIPSPTQMNIGDTPASSAFWNGYIERIALWPNTRLPNARLQALTT